MPLIYITGVAGTGKSAISRVLQSKGYTAYDTDLDDLWAWHHAATGQRLRASDAPKRLNAKWFAEYECRLVRERIEHIAREAEGNLVFLCGTSANDADIHHLLDKVIFLTIDHETLLCRLKYRKSNTFGKGKSEVAHVLHWLQPAEDYYRSFGAVMQDATAPLEVVVEQILSQVGV